MNITQTDKSGESAANDKYTELAQRAQLFLERNGGRASEAALIFQVFNVRGKPEIWGGILAQVLRDESRFRRLPGGEWVLTTYTDASQPLYALEYVVIDCETTGLNPGRSRVIEIAAIKLRNGQRVETFETFLNPHRRIPDYITKLTGISQEHVARAPGFGKIADKLVEFIGTSIVVGHNIPFDMRFINYELRNLQKPSLINETLDTITLALRLHPGLRRPNLDRLAGLLGLPVTNRHRAFGDASLTADAFLRLLDIAAARGYSTLEDLRRGRPSHVMLPPTPSVTPPAPADSVVAAESEAKPAKRKRTTKPKTPKLTESLFQMPLLGDGGQGLGVGEEVASQEQLSAISYQLSANEIVSQEGLVASQGEGQEARGRSQEAEFGDLKSANACPQIEANLQAEIENVYHSAGSVPSSEVAPTPNPQPLTPDLGSRPERIVRPRRPRYGFDEHNQDANSLTNRAIAHVRDVLSREFLKGLPDNPGVYLMKDASGRIIYIGKAKNLRKRVSQYYSEPLGYTRKMEGLAESIACIDHIVTGSELEALLLESRLIKKYLPRYNKQLRNYEAYPFIKINLQQRFPSVQSSRQIADDGARYFGPFQNRRAVEGTIQIIENLFPVRNCDRKFEPEVLAKQKRADSPCMRFHTHRCPGPCAGNVSDDDHAAYMQTIEEVINFLSGEKEAMLDHIWQKLRQAVVNRDFENAARLRDVLHQVEQIVVSQQFLAAAVEGNNLLICLPSAQTKASEILCIYRGRLGRQIRVTFDTPAASIASQLATIWQELAAEEAHFAATQPGWGKKGGRVIGQEAVDEINIIARWVYRNSHDPAIIRLADAPVWSEVASQLLERLQIYERNITDNQAQLFEQPPAPPQADSASFFAD